MAFQIKDFASIAASMINWMRASTSKITDFNVGSVARTLVEAPAIEIDELYQQMLVGLREAIPVSVYNSFDFQKKVSAPAAGLIRVTLTSSAATRLISASSTFEAEGRSIVYLSTADVTVPIGATFVDVPVSADTPGAAGNLTPGESFDLAPAPDGFVSATNLSAFVSGFDEETDDERKVRFSSYIASLARGTVAALKYGLQTTSLTDTNGNEIERVVSSSIVEPWLADENEPISLVNCYIHNGVGGTSSDLVSRAREVIYGYYDENGVAVPGWKAAGVNVQVFAAAEVTVAVTGALTVAAGVDEASTIQLAEEAVFSYLQGLPIGEPAIRSEIIAIVMNLDGVTNFIPTLPVGDTAATASQKLMPGAITVT